MGLTTFRPVSQKPKICHLRDDAHRDLSDFWPSPFQATHPSTMTSGQIGGKLGMRTLLNVPAQPSPGRAGGCGTSAARCGWAPATRAQEARDTLFCPSQARRNFIPLF